MIDWPLVLIVLAAVVVLGGLLWLAAWWYVPPLDLPGGPTVSDREGAIGVNALAGEFHYEDDEWADQLHEINQLGKFGDLTRPVAQLTHYEVEALIRTLAVPEWVPDQYRVAA